MGGDPAQGRFIGRNGQAVVTDVDPFADVREIQRELRSRGAGLTSEADKSSTGPASLTIVDPDGNQILIDQHR